MTAERARLLSFDRVVCSHGPLLYPSQDSGRRTASGPAVSYHTKFSRVGLSARLQTARSSSPTSAATLCSTAGGTQRHRDAASLYARVFERPRICPGQRCSSCSGGVKNGRTPVRGCGRLRARRSRLVWDRGDQAATRNAAEFRDRGFGRTTISTSRPRSTRKWNSRSKLNFDSFPRMRSEIVGWVVPSSLAASLA